MSASYTLLKKLIRNKKLEIIHILAPPRSNSNALELVLTQAPEVTGQLNEPFYQTDHRGKPWNFRPSKNNPTRSFNDGCRFILERYQKEDSSKKVVLVIHDHAKDLIEEEFKKLLELVRFEIFLVRNPIPNALSMLTRFVNEMLSQPGGNKLTSEEIIKMLKSDARFNSIIHSHPQKFSVTLINKLLGNTKMKNFSDIDFALVRKKMLQVLLYEFNTAWANIFYYYNLTRNNKKRLTYAVFDSSWLFDKPELHLKKLSNKLGITYTSDMLNHWTKGIGNDYQCMITRGLGKNARFNAWNGPARNSSGITIHPHSASSKVITLKQFPKEIIPAIQKTEISYRKMKQE